MPIGSAPTHRPFVPHGCTAAGSPRRLAVACSILATLTGLGSLSVARAADAPGAAPAPAQASQGAAPAGDKATGAAGVGGALRAVVISATRSEKTVEDAPVRIEVIDQVEIDRTKARTLTDALQNVPGLLLQEVHGKSGFELSLQGFTGDQVLVLIDGLPISASTGSSVDLNQYLVGDIERIEVIKGAASALFGSSAMGGVVNVITRPVARGLTGTALAEIGSRGDQNVSGRRFDMGLHHERVSIEGGGDLRGRLSLDNVGDRGFAVDPSGWSRQGDRSDRTQIAGRLEWQRTQDAQVYAELSHYREADAQRYRYYAPPNYIPQNKTEDIDRNRVTAGGRWRTSLGQFALKGVHETYDTNSREYSNAARINDRSASMGLNHLSGQYDAPAWGRQFWQFGFDLRRETLEQTNNGTAELSGGRNGDVARTGRELYVQNDILINEQWELVPGLRWQHDSDFGSKLAPKLAVRGRLFEAGDQSLTVRASVGNGYRVPNLTERHYLFDHRTLGYVVIGNPSLRPESSTSFQLGAAWQVRRDLHVDLNAYLNRARDLIQTDTANASVVDGIAYYTYRNVARARTAGIEGEVRWQLNPRWSLRTSATFAQTRDLDTGSELTRQPRRSGRLALDWAPDERITLTARARVQSSTLSGSDSGARSPGFGVADLRAQYAWRPGLVTYLAVDNLFGRQRDFANPSDFGPIAGRLIMIGLRYRHNGG